jgi:uncharacterized protein
MSRTSRLYQLQSLDSELDSGRRRLVELETLIAETPALKSARIEHARAEAQFKTAWRAMRELELEVKSLEEKISLHERQLYSGKVLNPREAISLQDEVASVKRWHATREEELLEAMLATESGEVLLAETQRNLDDVEAAWRNDQSALIAERDALQLRLQTFDQERHTIVDRLQEDDLVPYERLRRKKAGRAVVTVENGLCTGCRLTPSSRELQQARSGDEIVFCSSCGRILHVQ